MYAYIKIMQRKQIPIEEMKPMWGNGYHSPKLIKKIRKEGWEKIPPIPVIEIPEELRTDWKRYSFCDGHNRYDTAIATNTNSLDCIVYDASDNIKEVSRQTGEAELVPYHIHLDALKTWASSIS